ncbi:hypothetical protein GCM10012286_24410 [Streptomyces lasiicapitis]|uniref:Resuscitation-promoting factor core lysozyme-like domain-containing protein n=1 Tax=Streptomyces lasiicapitis TaxID=1923961 RepID=A0ABQ2LSM7_9ACTN|nr:hypothetical protein GCM10012286_24410 [Streptomyces lasiicapitis]
MGAFDASSRGVPATAARATTTAPATRGGRAMRYATPDAYNPDGGKRVKQAWQRYWTSQRQAARRHCDRLGARAYPAACR